MAVGILCGFWCMPHSNTLEINGKVLAIGVGLQTLLLFRF